MLRAVLHAHSDWSYDGHWSLTRIARTFGRLGVDAVMMSEHDTGFDPNLFAEYRAACVDASTSKCRLVPGIEYSSPDNDIHILVWGLDRFLAEHRPVSETLDAVATAGGAAVFAHPARRDAWAAYDPAWTDRLHGMEIWNRKTDGIAPGGHATDLIARTGLAPTVGMDFHKPRNLWPLVTRFAGLAPMRDPEAALVAALRGGGHAPEALWRPLLKDGAVTGAHARLEAARRAVLRLRR